MRSYGEKLLKEGLDIIFPNQDLLIGTRPDFLHGLELDFFYPKLKLAFEFQGRQHYYFTPDFQDNSKFVRQILYDIQKDLLCQKQGILLVRLNAVELQVHAIKGRVKQSLEKNIHPEIWEILYERHHSAPSKPWGNSKEHRQKVLDYQFRLKSFKGSGLTPSFMQALKYQDIFQHILELFNNQREIRLKPNFFKANLTMNEIVEHALTMKF